ADDHAVRHPGHQVGVAGLADRDDPAVADADVGLHDPPGVDDHRAGDDDVEHARRAGRASGLAHAIADDLAAAELRLLAGRREVTLDADEQLRVGQTHSITGGRTVEIGVLPARQPERHDGRSHAASFAIA